MASGHNGNRSADNISEREARIIHLFGLLAFAVQELQRLGYAKSSIEARRAILQLRYESALEFELPLRPTQQARQSNEEPPDTAKRTPGCNDSRRRYN